VVVIQQNQAFRYESSQAADIATGLLRDTSNVLVAEATALLYIGAAEGTDLESFWQEVLKALRYGELVDDEEGHEKRGPDVTFH
jgi:fibrillarin-like rRNA methylase